MHLCTYMSCVMIYFDKYYLILIKSVQQFSVSCKYNNLNSNTFYKSIILSLNSNTLYFTKIIQELNIQFLKCYIQFTMEPVNHGRGQGYILIQLINKAITS